MLSVDRAYFHTDRNDYSPGANSALDLADPSLETVSELSSCSLFFICNLVAIAFVALYGTSKELVINRDVDIIELLLLYNVSCFFFTLFITMILGLTLCRDVPGMQGLILIFMAVIFTISLIFTFLEALTLPLMICQVFNSMTPYVMVILAWLVLGESVTCITVIAFCLSFGGAALIASN